MVARQSRAQKNTIGRVMHEYKHGELETRGRKVRNPKQAVAIALSEAGASKYRSKRKNQAALKRTKAKERRGETAQALTERRGRKSSAGRRTTKTKRASTRTSSARRATRAAHKTRTAHKLRPRRTAARRTKTARAKTKRR
jgi:hypothetical protein